jgi:hypothetical protein
MKSAHSRVNTQAISFLLPCMASTLCTPKSTCVDGHVLQ